jgi:hypothetical protein
MRHFSKPGYFGLPVSSLKAAGWHWLLTLVRSHFFEDILPSGRRARFIQEF